MKILLDSAFVTKQLQTAKRPPPPAPARFAPFYFRAPLPSMSPAIHPTSSGSRFHRAITRNARRGCTRHQMAARPVPWYAPSASDCAGCKRSLLKVHLDFEQRLTSLTSPGLFMFRPLSNAIRSGPTERLNNRTLDTIKLKVKIVDWPPSHLHRLARRFSCLTKFSFWTLPHRIGLLRLGLHSLRALPLPVERLLRL